MQGGSRLRSFLAARRQILGFLSGGATFFAYEVDFLANLNVTQVHT